MRRRVEAEPEAGSHRTEVVSDDRLALMRGLATVRVLLEGGNQRTSTYEKSSPESGNAPGPFSALLAWMTVSTGLCHSLPCASGSTGISVAPS
jgi:hypothetical protein